MKKLYGAALLQPKRPARPALVNIDFAYRHVFKHGKLIEYSTGDLYYQGHRELPPVRATFLAFGFVPVTASLMVTELRPISIRSVSGVTAPPYPITVRATTTVAIGISDVDVNGVPLAIGPHCRPVSTTRLTLTGRGDNTIPPRGYTVPTGGPLSGRLTIPAFTDCGVTENLDPLLTGIHLRAGQLRAHDAGKAMRPVAAEQLDVSAAGTQADSLTAFRYPPDAADHHSIRSSLVTVARRSLRPTLAAAALAALAAGTALAATAGSRLGSHHSEGEI